MSADVDTIRAAAKQMRERALAATPGPWESVPAGAWTGRVFGSDHEMVAKTSTNAPNQHAAAEHIAGMHPAVALAVADWLDSAAAHADHSLCICDQMHHALTVARAYLST